MYLLFRSTRSHCCHIYTRADTSTLPIAYSTLVLLIVLLGVLLAIVLCSVVAMAVPYELVHAM